MKRVSLIELQCPECTQSVRFARDELVEGAVIACRHCGFEAELQQEYDTFDHKKRWFLVDPLSGDEEEERRA